MIEARIFGKTMNEKLHNAYLELQLRANCLYDKDANRIDPTAGQVGLRQILEKKEVFVSIFLLNSLLFSRAFSECT